MKLSYNHRYWEVVREFARIPQVPVSRCKGCPDTAAALSFSYNFSTVRTVPFHVGLE